MILFIVLCRKKKGSTFFSFVLSSISVKQERCMNIGKHCPYIWDHVTICGDKTVLLILYFISKLKTELASEPCDK